MSGWLAPLQPVTELSESRVLTRGLIKTVSIRELVATSSLWPTVLSARGVREFRYHATDDIVAVNHAELSQQRGHRGRGTLVLNLREVRVTTYLYFGQLVGEADNRLYSRIALLTGWPVSALTDLIVATGAHGLDLVVVRHLPYLLQEVP